MPLLRRKANRFHLPASSESGHNAKMSESPHFVGIDVGGQTIKAGVTDENGRLLAQSSVPTDAFKGQDHGLEQMARAARQAIADAGMKLADIAAVGVATPGPMDLAAGVILEPVNLRPWKNVPVRAYLQESLGRPVTFQNDANAAAYGEYWAGAGRGASSLALFTLGTGIGGGIIVNDFILEGAHSHGAELGHTVIQMVGGRLCGCGLAGHLEAYVGARSLVKEARRRLKTDQAPSSLRQTALIEEEQTTATAVEEETLDARHAFLLFQEAEAGDALASELVDEAAFALAIGVVNVMHSIDPEIILFVGGMTAAGLGFLERVRGHIKKHALPVPAAKTVVRYGELGTQAGLIGAAGCARRGWLLAKK